VRGLCKLYHNNYALYDAIYGLRISKLSRLDVIADISTHVKRTIASYYLSLYHRYCSVKRLIAIVVKALDLVLPFSKA